MATRRVKLKHWTTTDEALSFLLDFDGAELELSVEDTQPSKLTSITLATNSQELKEVIAILQQAETALASAEAKYNLAPRAAEEGAEEEEEEEEEDEEDEDEEDAEEGDEDEDEEEEEEEDDEDD